MNNPILITGAARSGTSMVAGIINMCGAFGGVMAGANKNNQKGMFENVAIRETLMKPYLSKMGVDRKGQYPLPDISKMEIPVNWRQKVEDILYTQGYKEGAWMYKGAKMCLTWPLWNQAFPNAKWIIVRRRTADITNSCIKTGFMNAFIRKEMQQKVGAENEKEAWTWWVRQHEKRFIEMINTGLNVKVVWPERMVDGDYQQMMEMIEWLGLKWNSDIYQFIDPLLWKSRNKRMIR